jgi:hypothetical protein
MNYFILQKSNKLLLILTIILACCANLSAQDLPVNGFVETGILTGTNGRIPFWLLSNQYGRFSPESGNGYIDAGIFSDSLDKKKTLGYDWGLEGFGRYDGKWAGWPQQAWLGAKWEFFYAFVGLKEEHFGSQDNQMSSGMIMWSGNARPLPKVSLATLDYVNVPFTKGFVQFQAGISHSWFGNNAYVKQSYLHHKYVYLKFGGDSRFHLSMGLHHFAVWGGVSPDYGKLPSSLKDFVKVFFAIDGHNDTIPGIPLNESQNRLGDHRGTKDFAIDYKFNEEWAAQAYWQNFIESKTGIGFHNSGDGLWGLVIKHNKKLKFCYEYLHSTETNAPFIDGEVGGQSGAFEDYFNNSVYEGSWQYKGYVIGTPLISSPILLSNKNVPYYTYYILNNRIIGHILSCFISTDPLDFFVRFSHTKNLGALVDFYNPPKIQNSLVISATRRNFIIKKLDASVSLAMDAGTLYGNHLGFEYKMRWNF